MDLGNFSRISVNKKQRKNGNDSKVDLKAFVYYNTLSLAILGTLAGCAESTPVDVKEDSTPQTPENSVVENTNSEESMAWEEMDKFDAEEYRVYINGLVSKYDKDVDSATVEDVAEFASKLNLFVVHANAALKEKKDEDTFKDLLITSNKVDALIQDNKDEKIVAEHSSKRITSNLTELSKSYKVCKALSIDAMNLKIGDTRKVRVTVLPSNADVNLTYSVNRPAVASVENGVVTAKASGRCKLTVTDTKTGVSVSTSIVVTGSSTGQTSSDGQVSGGQTSKPSQTSQSSQTSQTSKPSQSSQTSKPSQTSQTSKPSTQTSQTSQTSKPSQTSQTSKPSQTSQTSTPKPTPKPTVTFKNMSVNGVSSMTEGDTVTASATVYMSDGSTRTSGISWSSSNTGVVSVSSGGTLSARSAGSAIITATYDNHQASFTVSVSAKPQQQSTQPSGSNDFSYLVEGCPSGTTPHGRTYYAYYPIVDAINKERRALGLCDVQYADENWARERATIIGQAIKNHDSAFNSAWNEYIESGQSGLWNTDYTPKESWIADFSPLNNADNIDLDYEIEVGGHAPGTFTSIVGFVYYPTPERIVAAIKESKPHWTHVIDPYANAVECRIYIDTKTGVGHFAITWGGDDTFMSP